MAVRDAASLLVGLLLLCHTWGAWAAVDVNMEDRVEVFRGETAQITCMFSSPEGIGGLFIQWFYVTRLGEKEKMYYQDSTNRIIERGTQFTDRISVNVSLTAGVVLTISDVQLKDELEFICLIKGLTEGAGEGRTQLKVFERPDLPTIDGVQTGISISEELSRIGTCEVKNGYPKPNVTWHRNSMPLRPVLNVVDIKHSITTESSHLFSITSELNMKVEKANKDDTFYCEVTYFVPGGTRLTESDRIKINVLYPSTAVNVWVESPKGKIKEGDSIELHCLGNGNTQSAVITMKHEESGGTWDSKTVVLSNVTRQDSGVYTCSEMDLDLDALEEVTGNTTVFVNYLDAAVVVPKDTAVVGQGEELKATCNALSSLQTYTAWFKDGKEVMKGHTLTLKDATFDKAGTYVCVVTVPEIEGMETRGTLLVNVQGPPKIEGKEMEKNTEGTAKLKCRVRGFPAPTVIWTTSDGKVLQTASQTDTKEGVESSVSIKVTSDITAFCNASNEYGADAVTFNIKATIHTTTQATTTQATTTPATTTTVTTAKPETSISPKKIRKENSGLVIAVIIICILLLAILGSVLYFLYKKGKICGRSGKQDLTKEKSTKDNIVVEMKSDNTEEAVLLGVNGEKQPPNDQ
ncbi:melanoma cell adhesion molecule b isoform 2-T2 [Symphorus nematophorus]